MYCIVENKMYIFSIVELNCIRVIYMKFKEMSEGIKIKVNSGYTALAARHL